MNFTALIISIAKVLVVMIILIITIFGYTKLIKANYKFFSSLKYKFKKLKEEEVSEIMDSIAFGESVEEYVKKRIILGKIKEKNINEEIFKYNLILNTYGGLKNE